MVMRIQHGKNTRGMRYCILSHGCFAFGRNYWGDLVLYVPGRCFTLIDGPSWD